MIVLTLWQHILIHTRTCGWNVRFKHCFLAYNLCTAIRSLDDDFFRRRRLLSSWCSTRLHSALGAVTFTMAVTCLTATCLEKKHTLPPAISFPKDQQPWFMHPYSRCATVLYTHTIAMYGHRQPQGSEIFISPLRASGWEQGHYFSHCLKRNKK